MALDASVLAALMKSNVDALPPPSNGVDSAYRLSVFQAIAQAVVDHIHAAAVVSGPVTVASVGGVTTGAGTSGPGTGSMSAGIIT